MDNTFTEKRDEILRRSRLRASEARKKSEPLHCRQCQYRVVGYVSEYSFIYPRLCLECAQVNSQKRNLTKPELDEFRAENHQLLKFLIPVWTVIALVICLIMAFTRP